MSDIKGLNTPYRTSDLNYAAYLKIAGVPFVGTARDEKDPRRVFFLFDSQDANMEDLRLQFYNRVAKVAAFTYAEEIKGLKALLHA